MQSLRISHCAMLLHFAAVYSLVITSSLQCQSTNKENSFFRRAKRDFFTIEDRLNKSIPPLDITQTMVDGERRFPCFIRVGVFMNQNSIEPVPNAEVTVLTREINNTNGYEFYGYGNKYVGFTKTVTGNDGMACAPTLCFYEALIFVSNGGERLTLASNTTQFLPKEYFYIAQTRGEEVAFGPRYMGTMFGKKGPVYREMNKDECERSATSNSWYFRFVYLSVPERIHPIENSTSQPLSWYPYTSKSPNFAVCFLKVRINTNQNNIILNATSYDNKSNQSYGYSISGPKGDPDSADTSVRAACIEYRCPTSDPVRVDVRINPSICTYSSSNRELRVTHTATSFQVLIEQGNLYGPANGIYVANGVDSARALAKNWCIAGSSYYGSSFHANPSKQPLITYNCRVLGLPLS